MEYRVSWEIDLDAGSPREAATEAQRIQRDPGSTATVFTVVAAAPPALTKIDLSLPYAGRHRKACEACGADPGEDCRDHCTGQPEPIHEAAHDDWSGRHGRIASCTGRTAGTVSLSEEAVQYVRESVADALTRDDMSAEEIADMAVNQVLAFAATYYAVRESEAAEVRTADEA